MNRRTASKVALAFPLMLLAFSPGVRAQITSNSGDGVLNAPYRGTITSLRLACEQLSYGEVRTWIEPIAVPGLISGSVQLWLENPAEWDRSVLRLYEGLDASGPEIRLDQSSPSNRIFLSANSDNLKRLSLKSIATKTLSPLEFTFHYEYVLTDPNGSQTSSGSRSFMVEPVTGSFLAALPGLEEAFHFGTEVLHLQVGGAELAVPIGRTVNMIGAAFEFRENEGWDGASTQPALRKMYTSDVLLPGAAESVYIQQINQFRLSHSTYTKDAWGTPWPGHLPGFYNSADTFGPDGTHYDCFVNPTSSVGEIFRRYDRVRPVDVPDASGAGSPHPASLRLEYDTNNNVIVIRDQQVSPNSITLDRTAMGDVMRITTSDGRGWDIESDAVGGLIAGIVPDSGLGARYFEYNAARRVTRVKDSQQNVLYEFTYANDASGFPTILQAERRIVDGALRTVVEHVLVSPALERRKEYVAPGLYRQYDLAFDGATLTSVTEHRDVNASGPVYVTTYLRDTENPVGTVKLLGAQFPDSGAVEYDYDSHAQQDIEPAAVHFGFLTKATHSGPTDGSLVTYDVEYEFFHCIAGAEMCSASNRRLFHRPRIVRMRDGRGQASQVEFDYEGWGTDENGDGMQGHISNQLFSRVGPVIALGASGNRTPETIYEYYGEVTGGFRSLHLVRTKHDSGATRDVEYEYDALLRRTSQTVDPGGLELLTRYLYCDTSPTQDRITVDPDGYWTRARYDDDGRVMAEERFLNANAGNISQPCDDPTGPFYRTAYTYDVNGRLDEIQADNKDQNGNVISGQTHPIVTDHTYDLLGRLTQRVLDPGGIAQEMNYDYNWLNEIEREFDTTGRGRMLDYDGRGLLESETPLAENETPDTNLTTVHTYDAVGRLQFTYPPTDPDGPHVERVYDDFGRLEQLKRHPGEDGGNLITTTYEYDDANNVTRTTVSEDTVGVLSDATSLFDEGGFNYESRQRTVAGADNAADPVIQRKFDWAGNLVEERWLGDSTVGDRVTTMIYDDANRVEMTTDSEGGEIAYMRDGRGNVLTQTVRIDNDDEAVTSMQYDALGRVTRLTDPADAAEALHYRDRRYDSRGNLLRETKFSSGNAAQMTSVFLYDAAGRQTESADLATASGFSDPVTTTSTTTDRVVGFEYDADGRLQTRTTYNNSVATALETVTTYDTLGRVDRVTDPSGSWTDNDYAANGRMSQRRVNDGLSERAFTFTYDGHDRMATQTAEGDPQTVLDDLVTAYQYDGLGRQTRVTDPRLIDTGTEFDLVGRRTALVENAGGGALERRTEFGFNKPGQLITQTARNKESDGTALPDQITRYRYDTLGRLLRTYYPDTGEMNFEAAGCTDCVLMAYDDAGRMTSRTDQRGFATTFLYDDRGLLLERTTATIDRRDSFAYDEVGRMTLAQRGTQSNADAFARCEMPYLDIGDLDFEDQTIAEGTTRRVDYAWDQAGNRIGLSYPGGASLSYVPTVLNQVSSIDLGTESVSYSYHGDGRLPQRRETQTTESGMAYRIDWGYDSQRRTSSVANVLVDGMTTSSLAAYAFTHDANGNPLTQAASGDALFADDDRTFTHDELDRLATADYAEHESPESATLDLLGNRESFTDRAGATVPYGAVNAANEYATIDGQSVAYDAAGNLVNDEAGREYTYDEQNRLTEVRDASDVLLASYTHDALGRRVTAAIGEDTTRYYYDGRRELEERDAADTRVRYHVNGGLFVDERIATFADGGALTPGSAPAGDSSPAAPRGAGAFRYYLSGDNHSVLGHGDANGTNLARFDYSAGGDFAGEGGVRFHDSDDNGAGDGDIDLVDFLDFQECFGQTSPDCLAIHDSDGSDVVDLGDFQTFGTCYSGPNMTPPAECLIDISPPDSGSFVLHGRPLDVLPDGKTLLYVRARHYDPRHSRWLQRDPAGYRDGGSLYESFGSNSQRFVDPDGRLIEELFNWYYVGKYASSAEIDAAIRTNVPLERVRSGELLMLQNAAEAVFYPPAAARLPEAFVQEFYFGFYEPSVDAATTRLTAASLAQLEAGAGIEEATSAAFLSALLAGDVLGVTPLLESGFDVDLATGAQLSGQEVDFLLFGGSERLRRGLEGGGTLGILLGGPEALRAAQARNAALVAPETTSLPILNPHFTPTVIDSLQAQKVLQSIVTRNATRVGADPSFAGRFLSRPEFNVARLGMPSAHQLAPLSFGKAVERSLRDAIRGDELLRPALSPRGIGSRGVDIIGVGPAQGLRFEVTTNTVRQILEHQRRYGGNLSFLTYEIPPGFQGFP